MASDFQKLQQNQKQQSLRQAGRGKWDGVFNKQETQWLHHQHNLPQIEPEPGDSRNTVEASTAAVETIRECQNTVQQKCENLPLKERQTKPELEQKHANQTSAKCKPTDIREASNSSKRDEEGHQRQKQHGKENPIVWKIGIFQMQNNPYKTLPSSSDSTCELGSFGTAHCTTENVQLKNDGQEDPHVWRGILQTHCDPNKMVSSISVHSQELGSSAETKHTHTHRSENSQSLNESVIFQIHHTSRQEKSLNSFRSQTSANSHAVSQDHKNPRNTASSVAAEEPISVTVKERVDGPLLNEGAGTFRVHTIPPKLMGSITSHELLVVWPLLKHEIGRKIWGDERFEPVPTVVDGAIDRYQLGTVLLKMQLSTAEKWRMLHPRCQALGAIYDLIWHTDMPVDTAVEMAAPIKVGEGAPWPNHRFHGLIFKGGYCRQVAVSVCGCHRIASRPFPTPDNDLVLNLYRFSGRYRTDKMYVITDVIYAEELHVTVRVSIRIDDVKILRRVPLAFRLHVYEIKDLTKLMSGRPYERALKVRWIGLDDRNLPTLYPRKSRGMGDVTKRTSDATRNAAGMEILPNRNRRGQQTVDNGGDRPVQPAQPGHH